MAIDLEKNEMNKLFVNQHKCGGSEQYLDADWDQWVDGKDSFTTNRSNAVNPALNQQFFLWATLTTI